jgi:long-chain acyl-CoA synthetase
MTKDDIYYERPWRKHYPDHVAADLEITKSTALADFKQSAVTKPDDAAVYYFDHEISYSMLDRLSTDFAAALAALGVKRGDRVIVDLQNVPQFMVAVYGGWKAGAIIVPINPMYKDKEVAYFCRDAGARVLVTQEDIAQSLDLKALQKISVERVITTSPLDMLPPDKEVPGTLKGVEKRPQEDTLDMFDLIEKYKDREVPDPGLSPDDVAYLTYTSGTTGPPKGAMNTHGNIAFNARVYRTMLQLGNADVVLGVAPLFHVTGEVAHLATAALAGIPVVLFYRFDAGEALRMIEKWRVTTTVASITVYIALMNHPDLQKRDLSSLVKAYSGGAPVSAAIVDQFEKLTGLYIYNAYGMTETNSPSHLVPWGQRAPVDPESGALSVGLPVPNCIVKIMDLNEGTQPLGPGEVGEIVDSGPIVIPGYWNKEEETRHAIRDGWLYTGDVGKMDEEGWFYVVDRKKDLIVASGYKVWPRDVEDVIYQHPAVKEAAVVGEADPYRGETVKAYVALKPGMAAGVTPEEIISFCKSRMAAYKYPRKVELVEEIPKTLTGKFLRRTLREKTLAS